MAKDKIEKVDEAIVILREILFLLQNPDYENQGLRRLENIIFNLETKYEGKNYEVKIEKIETKQ